MKPALFVSDLHLAPSRPASAAAFHAWARGPARDASAVCVLGDLFDAWIGDEQAAEPFAREVVASLRGIADAGVPVAVMHGNRDFLLGDRFARAAGARAWGRAGGTLAGSLGELTLAEPPSGAQVLEHLRPQRARRGRVRAALARCSLSRERKLSRVFAPVVQG